jgi:S1-C subfamily serine protease
VGTFAGLLDASKQGDLSSLGLDAVGIYANANRSVVTLQGYRVQVINTIFGSQRSVETVTGSGFVIMSSGSYYILTNYHVMDRVVNSTVTFWNGDSFKTKLIGSDAYSDLAVVTVNASAADLIPIELVSSSLLRVGQPVLAVGNPFGLSGTVTFGIISQLGRSLRYDSGGSSFLIADVIQFSAPINPGNSGGPLLNANGKVIGITSAVVSGSQGVGFAIPSDTIIRELPSLINTGKYDMHPYIGFQGTDMNYPLSVAIGTDVTYGVLVQRVNPGGPAEKAGLKGGEQVIQIAGTQYLIGGDIITSINSQRTVNFDALSTYLERNTLPGQTIQVGVVRSGNYMVVQLTLSARPTR